MPGRQIPPEIRAYLGPCREPRGLVEKVIEECGLAKLTGDSGLTDFDPLVVILTLVTSEIEGRGKSLDEPRVRRAWCEIVQRVQNDEAGLDHNSFLPCRFCDQAFEPVVDETLLALFLAWHRHGGTANLLAIHRCPACGGTLAAKETRQYEGDMHTPEPGHERTDEEWVALLLQHAEL